MRTDESMIHVAPAFWHLSQGALGFGLGMHRSFWPRHLSHASCWGFSFLGGFIIPDPDSNPEKQLEGSGRGMLDVIKGKQVKTREDMAGWWYLDRQGQTDDGDSVNFMLRILRICFRSCP
jgi:hypothetical protein